MSIEMELIQRGFWNEAVAYIFEDVDGYHVNDARELVEGMLHTTMRPSQTKADAMRFAAGLGYDYVTGSGTYWPNQIRRIPSGYRQV
jgi:hypothetical protein